MEYRRCSRSVRLSQPAKRINQPRSGHILPGRTRSSHLTSVFRGEDTPPVRPACLLFQRLAGRLGPRMFNLSKAEARARLAWLRVQLFVLDARLPACLGAQTSPCGPADLQNHLTNCTRKALCLPACAFHSPGALRHGRVWPWFVGLWEQSAVCAARMALIEPPRENAHTTKDVAPLRPSLFAGGC